MNLYALMLKALCGWREARGISLAAQRGVMWTVDNRVAAAQVHKGLVNRWGGDVVSVILFPWQYSSFNAGDLNAVKFPKATDTVYPQIISAAQDMGDDPTGGAHSYYDNSIAPPNWALSDEFIFTVTINTLHFYKLNLPNQAGTTTP